MVCLMYVSNVRIGLFFDGKVGAVEELPKPKDMEEEDYNIYRGRVGLITS